LVAFHAITGCDTVSQFSGIGKKTAWKVFLHAELLDNLGIGDYTEVTFISCEKFVSLLYMSVANAKPITSINELRHDLFTKGQKEADKLPPTKSALTEHLKRAHYQSFVWRQSTSAEISLPSPVGHGWYADSEGYLHPQLMPATVAAVRIRYLKCCSANAKIAQEKDVLAEAKVFLVMLRVHVRQHLVVIHGQSQLTPVKRASCSLHAFSLSIFL
jgi:hypothetical protein